MSLTITILGCGNSSGIPAAGNYWGKCDPNEPKNRRSRPSLCVQSAQKTIIIDTGPDFREQTIRENIGQLDAILLTHAHGDHVHGIDDMRRFVMLDPGKEQMPIYTNQETFDEIEARFYYLFKGGDNTNLYPPLVEKHILNDHYGKTISIGDINVIPFPMIHGNVTSVGYRFGTLAYCTDLKSMNQQSLDIIKGIDTLIIDSAGYHQDSNPVHANFNEINEMNKHIGAKTIYLTSLSLAMDYQTLLSELPDSIIPCYDGLKLQI